MANFIARFYANAVCAIVVCLSVCLSVRPSLCPSQGTMVSKRLNVESSYQCCTTARNSSFRKPNIPSKLIWTHPNEAQIYVEWVEIGDFPPVSRISQKRCKTGT